MWEQQRMIHTPWKMLTHKSYFFVLCDGIIKFNWVYKVNDLYQINYGNFVWATTYSFSRDSDKAWTGECGRLTSTTRYKWPTGASETFKHLLGANESNGGYDVDGYVEGCRERQRWRQVSKIAANDKEYNHAPHDGTRNVTGGTHQNQANRNLPLPTVDDFQDGSTIYSPPYNED